MKTDKLTDRETSIVGATSLGALTLEDMATFQFDTITPR
jgi:hypothetical protein